MSDRFAALMVAGLVQPGHNVTGGTNAHHPSREDLLFEQLQQVRLMFIALCGGDQFYDTLIRVVEDTLDNQAVAEFLGINPGNASRRKKKVRAILAGIGVATVLLQEQFEALREALADLTPDAEGPPQVSQLPLALPA
ncbi:MAG: hypothetical protein U0871_15055 [Gemmataceae bacterium]